MVQTSGGTDEHCRLTYASVARRLAQLLSVPFEGWHDPGRHAAGDCYVVPDETLCPPAAARALGVQGDRDLFGGIVPHPFVATKCVSHGLVAPGAARPDGWVDALAQALDGVVLPGHTAFALDDAVEAARRLLARHGAVRIKPPTAMGGGGQSVHRDLATATARFCDLTADAIARDGIVVESDLAEAATWSVGLVRVGDLEVAYHGTQRTTTNNHGNTVYGGSTLHVIRGGWEALVDREHDPGPAEAIRLARRYHEAMRQAYPGFVASRCNYDVISGRDAEGRARVAVLEQSWRIGGASGAEVAALLRFRDDPRATSVVASTHERYGAGARAPAGAHVQYDGDDRHAGRILKYVVVDTDDHH